MKISIKFFFLAIALISADCSNGQTRPDNKSNDNKTAARTLKFPKTGEDTLKASYFADTVIYIPLETTTESFITDIKQLWMNDSYILVHNLKGGILMFDKNGKFIRQIGKEGRGPGEYGSIFHFDVIRDTIYVSSSGRRGFLRYTFDGTFCDEIKLNYEPIYFSTTDDQKLVSYNKQRGKIFVYNKNLYTPPDTIVVEYGVTKGRYNWSLNDPSFMTHLQKTISGLYFTDYRNDTVWKISNKSKEPAFILDMKKPSLPYDKQVEFCNGDFVKFETMAKPYFMSHLIPFPSLMFIFQKNWYDTKYDAIYLDNSKTGEIKKYTSYIYDDIVSKQELPYAFFIYSSDYLVLGESPLAMHKNLDKIKKNLKEEPSLSWLNQMKTVNKDDNEILVLFKLKKNLN